MPSSGLTATSGIGSSWTNPNNVANTTLASQSITHGNETIATLQGSGFGFAIPAGATINGIVASYQRRIQNISYLPVNQVSVYLMKAGTSVPATLTTGSTSWTATQSTDTVGTSTSLWGTTWLYSDINNSGFGLYVYTDITNTASLASYTAYLGDYQITVYYTLGGAKYVTTCTCT